MSWQVGAFSGFNWTSSEFFPFLLLSIAITFCNASLTPRFSDNATNFKTDASCSFGHSIFDKVKETLLCLRLHSLRINFRYQLNTTSAIPFRKVLWMVCLFSDGCSFFTCKIEPIAQVSLYSLERPVCVIIIIGVTDPSTLLCNGMVSRVKSSSGTSYRCRLRDHISQ